MEPVKKVYVIVVNFNGWADTLECLETVYRSSYPDYQVVVVDNDSSDDSLERVRAWADGRLNVWIGPDNPLRRLSFPPVRKPLSTVTCFREEAERGEGVIPGAPAGQEGTRPPLVLIRAGGNTGYAGGNNIGLRYAEKRGDGDYFWLLNNDTAVNADSLGSLIDRAEEYRKSGARVGILGSKLLHYGAPSTIQSLGGCYRPFTGKIRHLGEGEPDGDDFRGKGVVEGSSYISGASMLLSAAFVGAVGKLSEDYFLYFEELDLAERARRQGWGGVVCLASTVFHKEGATIMGGKKYRSAVGDYHYLRSRIIVTRKYFPRCLWMMYLGLLVAALNRLRRGQPDRLRIIWRVFIESLSEASA